MGFRNTQPKLLLALFLGGGRALLGTTAAAQEATQGSCIQRNTTTLIYPGDPRWTPSDIAAGTSTITGTNPRSGNGSLELTTSGSLDDWGFFRRVADGGGSWGLLSAINCLTFDWWRDSYTLPSSPPPALTAETWQEQTPAFRVLVRDFNGTDFLYSQLIWERWYNTIGVLDPTENDQWHYQDITGQLFWRHFDGGLTYTNKGCINGSFTDSSDLQTFSLLGWATSCYSTSAQVYGVMLGVGSQWPGPYHGFVDNVQLSLTGQQNFVVQDNFELPQTVVPEPAALVLIATGLMIVALATFLQRRRQRSDS